MSTVAVQKVDTAAKETAPVFADIGKMIDEVKRRAFSLFERRGGELGHEIEDWLDAEHEVFAAWPAAELKEKDGTYELEITLPGFDAKEIEVTATPGEVAVHAATKHEAKEEKKTEEGKVFFTEFGSNDVYRHFDFPETVDVANVTANLEKGILHIAAPKSEAANVKRTIPIAA
jgi:HSP20 family protein